MSVLQQLLDDVVVHQFELKLEVTAIGRRSTNDIVIEDSAVSADHARIIRQPNTVFSEYMEAWVEDSGSTNGTWLNEQPVVGRQRLHHNDRLRVAWNHFRFIDENEEQMEKTVHMLKTQ